jgi:NAD(P)-dependent dehydrogenase (short-subunit alcohol dehydrogenase family)
MSLRAQRVVIVGGSAGIGKATARAALAAGAAVVVASHDEASLEQARTELGGVEVCQLDVRDPRVLDHCFRQMETFDHLVVTAAEASASPFVETDPDAARRILDVKFWGAFNVVQAALRVLRPTGSVTLFSGIAAHRPVRGLAVVAAANAAVEALTRALAVELCPLRVNAVCPGFVDTHELDEEKRKALANSLLVRRVGEPDDVAQAVLFLLQNPYMTGTVLHIDGGKMIS